MYTKPFCILTKALHILPPCILIARDTSHVIIPGNCHVIPYTFYWDRLSFFNEIFIYLCFWHYLILGFAPVTNTSFWKLINKLVSHTDNNRMKVMADLYLGRQEHPKMITFNKIYKIDIIGWYKQVIAPVTFHTLLWNTSFSSLTRS